MLSVSNLLCDHQAGNERLRYGHTSCPLVNEDPYHGAPRPVVVWAVTRACNLRCVHCYASADANPAPNELSHDEGKALLDDLAEFGVPAVLFSGGEPLVRPDTPELIEYGMSLGLSCTLSTNGLLIDDAMADRLAELGVKYAGISLDGLRARHDKPARLSGAFDGTWRRLTGAGHAASRSASGSPCTALNEMDLDALFDICIDHDVSASASTTWLTPAGEENWRRWI